MISLRTTNRSMPHGWRDDQELWRHLPKGSWRNLVSHLPLHPTNRSLLFFLEKAQILGLRQQLLLQLLTVARSLEISIDDDKGFATVGTSGMLLHKTNSRASLSFFHFYSILPPRSSWKHITCLYPSPPNETRGSLLRQLLRAISPRRLSYQVNFWKF